MWAEEHKPIQKWANVEENLMELWENLMSRLSKAGLEWIATTMRRIWLRRNGFIFEEVFQSPSKVVELARISMEEFQSANVMKKGPQNTPMIGRLVKNLNKPPSEFVKANWDTALELRTKRMEIGIIVRDESGEVLVIVCVQKKYASLH